MFGFMADENFCTLGGEVVGEIGGFLVGAGDLMALMKVDLG